MIAQLQKHVRLWFLTAIALLAAIPPAIARDFTYEYAGQTSSAKKTKPAKQSKVLITIAVIMLEVRLLYLNVYSMVPILIQ